MPTKTPKSPKVRQPDVGQYTTAQLQEMKILACHGAAAALCTMRFNESGVRIWLQDATGECWMETRDNTASKWQRVAAWFGGLPVPKDSK